MRKPKHVNPVSVAIREFATGLRGKCDELMRDSLSQFATELVTNSPVKTGHYVYNWRFSSVGVPGGELEGVDPGKSKTLGRLKGDIRRYSVTGKTAYFANTVPYAQQIEYGSSKQAPTGVLRNAINLWPQMVMSAAKRASRSRTRK